MSGIYPGAIWRPVPNYGYSPPGTHGQLLANGPRGAFWHDAQGWMEGAFSTFCDPKRGSAHFIFSLSEGKPFQFIDCDDAAWHCGGYIPGTGAFANLFFWGFEFEGGYPTPTPITDYQIQESTKVCRWLSEHYGFTWQGERRKDLWEHGEVYNTNCPNGRIRWPEVIAALKEGDMDADEVRKIVQTQVKGLLAYDSAADDKIVAGDQAKIRVQTLSVLPLIGHALAGEWAAVNRIMRFYGWDKITQDED